MLDIIYFIFYQKMSIPYNIHMGYDSKIQEILKDMVEKYPRSYFKKIKARKNHQLLKYIKENTPLLSDEYYLISTKVYWIIHNIVDFPRCKICNKPITKNVKINEGYPHHCSAKCLSDDPEVQKKKIDSYSNRYGEGITNPFQSSEVIKKINDTNMKKYGVKRFTQTESYRNKILSSKDEISKKRYLTHKTNNSFNTSTFEKVAFDVLRNKYPDLISQYKSDVYPFTCDFYSPSYDLYIEYNGSWTHGGHAFNKDDVSDMEVLTKWTELSKKYPYYANAIYTWTDLDVRKQKCAIDNNLNIIFFWDIMEVYEHVFPNHSDVMNTDSLILPYNRKVLQREFEYYKNVECSHLQTMTSHRNEIVKFFQQDNFFRYEKEMWKNNPDKRKQLIVNRLKFLNKTPNTLTVNDIICGFKRSGMHYGYSHFNPLWFKWFINRFDVKICYDPCGGWGHRLLGGMNLEKYIYNDLSLSTKSCIDKMVDFYGLKNVVTHCNDTRTFIPDDDFDAMFTCPPYYNVEKYECGEFKDISDFNCFMDSLFDVFMNKTSCKIFGLVIREDLLAGHDDYIEKYELNTSSTDNYLSNSKRKLNEFLYVFRK